MYSPPIADNYFNERHDNCFNDSFIPPIAADVAAVAATSGELSLVRRTAGESAVVWTVAAAVGQMAGKRMERTWVTKAVKGSGLDSVGMNMAT